jgi:spermidine synthase
MAAVPRVSEVLILGGGDGLAAREVLKFEAVEHITLVDLDPVMTELGRRRPELVALNQGSLSSPKVTVVNADAMEFLEDDSGFYQVIICDLPDPSNVSLCRLYSDSFYALAARRLALGGVLVTQATSPYFAPAAFWCIATTIEAVAGGMPDSELVALPYHAHVPSFGEWGFVLAARHTVDPDRLEVRVPTRFLTRPALRAMFVFPRDMQPLAVEVNGLDNPVLYGYYRQGWQHFNE